MREYYKSIGSYYQPLPLPQASPDPQIDPLPDSPDPQVLLGISYMSPKLLLPFSSLRGIIKELPAPSVITARLLSVI